MGRQGQQSCRLPGLLLRAGTLGLLSGVCPPPHVPGGWDDWVGWEWGEWAPWSWTWATAPLPVVVPQAMLSAPLLCALRCARQARMCVLLPRLPTCCSLSLLLTPIPHSTMQLFFRFHIICFFGFFMFSLVHYVTCWTYFAPGEGGSSGQAGLGFGGAADQPPALAGTRGACHPRASLRRIQPFAGGSTPLLEDPPLCRRPLTSPSLACYLPHSLLLCAVDLTLRSCRVASSHPRHPHHLPLPPAVYPTGLLLYAVDLALRSGQLASVTPVVAASVDENAGVATLRLKADPVRSWGPRSCVYCLYCLYCVHCVHYVYCV